MDVAALEARCQPGAAVLDEVHLDAGVPPSIARKKAGEQGLHRLRGGADPEHPGLSPLEGPGPLAERVGVRQQSAGSPQEVFALRSELDATPDPVEEADVQLGLEGADLTRQRRLTQIQSGDRPAESAGVDDAHEGA